MAVFVISFFVYLIAGIRTLHFKFWASKQDRRTKGASTETSFSMNSQTLFSYTANGLILFFMLSCLLIPIKINKMDIVTLSTYPNYIWFYLLHHYAPSSTIAMTVILYYGKTPTLRKHAWIELRERLAILKSCKQPSANKIYVINAI